MATFTSTRYFLLLLLVNVFYFRFLNGEQNKSFSFKNFSKDSKFESRLALYGDARVVKGGESIQISGSVASSAGRVVYEKPFKLAAGLPVKMVSFSMNFVFSMSEGNGDGLVFMLVSEGFPLNVFDGGSFGLLGGRKERFLGVEFDTFQDDKYGDMNDNHVGIDVGSLISVKSRNLSSVSIMLKSGEKLQSWIDYEASSRRLEVRLAKLGVTRPVNSLLSCPIELSRIWKGGKVLVGLSASNGNSSQTCNLYSWSFVLRTPPAWLHSQPLNPDSYNDKKENIKGDKKSDCALKVFTALIFGTGCGALGAFAVLFMWIIFGNRRPVVPEDYDLPTKEVRYKMQEAVVVDKISKDGVMK